MKTRIAMRAGNTRALIALCLASAMLLGALVAPVVASDNDSVTNSGLPTAAPAPSGLANVVWMSVDRSKKKGRFGKKDKTPVAVKVASETQDSAPVPGPAPEAVPSNSVETTVSQTSPAKGVISVPDLNTTRLWDSPAQSAEPSPVTLPKSEPEAKIETASPVSPTPPLTTVENTTPEAAVSAEGPFSYGNPTEPKNSEVFSAPSIASNLTILSGFPVVNSSPVNESGGPIVVDTDEVVEEKPTLEYEDLPTDEGKTRVKAGARFPVVMISQITSKTTKKGDPIQGRLKYDLKIGERLIAPKGSIVNGHVNYCLKARTILHSLVSPERWYRNSGCLGVAFDEIINHKGEHLPLVAQPSRASRIVKNKAEGRELGVNHNGQITGPWGPQLRHKAVRIGLNFAMAPAGAFTFGAMPVALGVIGACNPSFAFSKPVGLNVRHRRLKGFAWGFLSGVPGSWLIEDTTVKGQEAVIKPGDEFYAEFVEEFTGEPATDAQLMPGASTKVRGQVVDDGMAKTKSKKKK